MRRHCPDPCRGRLTCSQDMLEFLFLGRRYGKRPLTIQVSGGWLRASVQRLNHHLSVSTRATKFALASNVPNGEEQPRSRFKNIFKLGNLPGRVFNTLIIFDVNNLLSASLPHLIPA